MCLGSDVLSQYFSGNTARMRDVVALRATKATIQFDGVVARQKDGSFDCRNVVENGEEFLCMRNVLT